MSDFEMTTTNNQSNDLTAQGSAMVNRQAAEVQAAMVVAKKFPRDENASYSRIMKACSRKSLAEQAVYAYPRGGERVTGPSIRMAEMLAQNWGNLDFGITELEQNYGESSVMAYCWDLETNTRQTKIFSVKHERKAQGAIKKLTDPRDIYELVANQGARRVRACILGIIPGDIVDKALEECEKTMQSNNKEPLSDRIRATLAGFEKVHSVTKEMIEKHIGFSVEKFTETELVKLQKIHNSLKDKIAKREDFFDFKEKSALQEITEAEKEFAAKKEKKND